MKMEELKNYLKISVSTIINDYRKNLGGYLMGLYLTLEYLKLFHKIFHIYLVFY